ncbi:MAG: carbohydrate ABC transporter permease [Pseudothermotoga sp.]
MKQYLFILPLVVFLVALPGYLFVSTFFISLREVNFGVLEGSKFIGLKNFSQVIGSRSFWQSMRFSLLFGSVTTVSEIIIGFLVALFVYNKFRGNRLVITLLVTPILIAPSLFGLMNRILFNNFIGLVPGYIKFFFHRDIDFFSPANVFTTLVFIDCLQWTPFAFLILYASMLGIPPQLMEASKMDGAGYIEQIWFVVIPYLLPSITSTLLLRFTESFRVFDTVYVLTGGGPGDLTTSISIYIYRLGFVMGDHGSASAAGMILFAIMIFFVILTLKLSERKW